MASITGRYTALEDVTVLDIKGENVMAIFRTANLEVTSDEIDVSAAMDTWKKREFGQLDWRCTCTALIASSPIFLDAIISGGQIVVEFGAGDGAGGSFNFLGTGMITGAPLAIDNPMTQEITVLSAGNTPTVSFGT